MADESVDLIKADLTAGQNLEPMLQHLERKDQRTEGIFLRVLEMLKGKPSKVDPDGDGDIDVPRGNAGDVDNDEGDARMHRGPARLMKGMACKGDGCGFETGMSKSHRHYGAKHAPAMEALKGMACPKCGEHKLSPIMLKGDEEYGDEGGEESEEELEKGLYSPAVNQAVKKIRDAADNAARAVELYPSIAAVVSDMSEMIKGLSEQVASLTGKFESLETDLAKGEAFNVGLCDALEVIHGNQTESATKSEALADMIKGLEGGLVEMSEMVKGLDHAAPRQVPLFDSSAFTRVTENQRSAAPVVAPKEEMSKGADVLSDEELLRADNAGIITSAQRVMYQRDPNVRMGRYTGAQVREALAKLG